MRTNLIRSFLFLIALVFPITVTAQTFVGNYRAVIFNPFSSPSMIVAEFEVKPDNSLAGRLKFGEEIRDFAGAVDKKGRFEAIIEQNGGETFKIKGKFDKQNKISFVQRSQSGSGLNKSVSENAIEGTFSRFEKPRPEIAPTVTNSPPVELVDTGKSWLKVRHASPLFNEDWTEFAAVLSFGSNAKMTMNMGDPPDYFNLAVKSGPDNERALRLNVLLYTSEKKIWKMTELRTAAYQEIQGNERRSYIAGSGLQTDPLYADGSLEIVRETETQIVFRFEKFKIKQFAKNGFVEINGFVYVDKTLKRA